MKRINPPLGIVTDTANCNPIFQGKDEMHIFSSLHWMMIRCWNLEIPTPKEGTEVYHAKYASSGKQRGFTTQRHPQIAQKCTEIHHSQKWLSGQCGIRNTLQKIVRTWIRLLPVPPPGDGEVSRQRVYEPGARISWPRHHTTGHAGPRTGPRVAAAQLAPSLEQEQEPGDSCPFSDTLDVRQRRARALPRHRTKHHEAMPGLAVAQEVIPSSIAAAQAAHFLSSIPSLLISQKNCWEVFSKRHQAHTDYF